MNELCRYRQGNDRDIDALFNRKIWFSKPSAFNDPYDCAMNFSLKKILTYYAEDNSYLSGVFPVEVMTDVYYNENKTGSVLLKSHKLLNNLYKELTRPLQDITVACFFPNFKSLPMWSYYANQHEGFCVQYAVKNLDMMGVLGQVDYKKDLDALNRKLFEMVLTDDYSTRNIDNLLCSYVLTKSEEWSHEKERRVIRFNSAIPNGDKGIEVDAPKPTKIFLGCRAEEKLINEIKDYGSEFDVPVYRMEMMPDEFTLEPNEI